MIDEEQQAHEFQSDENNDHVEIEVVHMVNQTHDPLIQYIYTSSRNKSATSEPREEELH